MALRLLFVVNDAGFFLSHRLPLAQAARDEGYDVHVATPDDQSSVVIQSRGFVFHPIPIARRGMHPLVELRSIRALRQLYRELAPDIVHHVTIKPVLYGGIAARLAGVPAVVNAVTGLGYIFISRGVKSAILRRLVKATYRFALRQARTRVIFQNPDDMALFEGEGLVRPSDAVLIRGSGVDMAVFLPRPEAVGIPIVLLASRMIWDKGVAEFVEAARLLHDQGITARFVLVGGPDSGNPSTIPQAQLEAWQKAMPVEWWGIRVDMPQVFAESHIVCLPSYYGEGIPKVLIEAAACARALVTTDTPGCREIVQHEINGLLVPPRDAYALAKAIRQLLQNPELRAQMGRRGREIAMTDFSLQTVIDQTLGVYRDLLS